MRTCIFLNNTDHKTIAKHEVSQRFNGDISIIVRDGKYYTFSKLLANSVAIFTEAHAPVDWSTIIA